jgi:uncharacterized protein (TIGR02996 family)
MRSFQFSDAKSHKFWTIDVQGSAFTVTYGKVGTAGQTQTKTFPSAEKAQAEADKLIREKTGKGYRETTPKAEVSQAEAFEAGLLDHPDDIARWSAYSDYLTERGDPRGEFMRVQLALEDESLSAADRKKLKAAETKLLKAHEREWLGPLAAFTVDAEKEERWRDGKRQMLPPVFHEFERGWLRRLEFPELSVAQARAFAACKDARLIRTLVVEQGKYEAPEGTNNQYARSFYPPGPDVPSDMTDSSEGGLHALTRCPHLGAIRSFQLGEGGIVVTGDDYASCHTSGDLAHHLVKQMPRVEHLAVHAQRVDANKLFTLPMPNLRTFSLLHTTGYPLDKLAANKTLTNLTTLQCHPHAMEYGDEENGAYIRLPHLRAVCRSPYLKKLNHLCLRLTDFGDAGVKEIVSSGLLERLTVLDLRGGCVSDKGAALLAASPHLPKLKFLNLRRNALTDAGVTAIRATKVNADLDGQHTTTAFDPDGEIPDYLYEGDYE